jgi:hypothetical protein
MSTPRTRRGGTLFLLLSAGLLTLGAAAPAHAQGKKLALLVGCTQYPNANLRELWGPAHDVRLWARLLTTRFGFADKDVTRLVGWPDDPKKRPTYANIAAAFRRLTARADGDTQVFILLSGHGVQIPIPDTQKDPLDPKNPEPDGMDEVFLPADVEQAGPDGKLKNHLLDDELGAWLDQLRDKGARVWIVFDCCHSGTMMRGTDEVERPREVKPKDLGISEKAIEKAARRAQEAVAAARKQGKPVGETGLLDVKPAKGPGKGSVVGFYAAQAFEQAPELPRPADAPRTSEHYYGLMSYTLVKTLEQLPAAVSYRQLGRILVARYVAERGSHGPTPFFEGTPLDKGDSLDLKVLGAERLGRGRDIVLSRFGPRKELRVNAGDLHGLTRGSVLVVHPPAGGKRGPDAVLGHVRVVGTLPTAARVEPCPGPKGGAAAKAGQLPDLASCTILTRDFGDLRLKVAVRAASEKDRADAGKVVRLLRNGLDPEVRQMIAVTEKEAEAQWVVWVEKGRLVLRLGEGQVIDPKQEQAADKARRVRRQPAPPRSFGGYPLTDPALARRLGDDLQMIFTASNLMRIAGALGNPAAGGENYGLKLEVIKLKGPEGSEQPDGPLPPGAAVFPGQVLRTALSNEGLDDLWVSVIRIDGNFKITVRTYPMRSGGPTIKETGDVGGDAFGRECILVLGVPQRVSRDRPDLEFLAQDGLKELRESKRGLDRGARTRDAAKALPTPFGQLLTLAATGKGGTRSYNPRVPTNPVVLMYSWETVLPPPGPRSAGAAARP